jgi:hypothetical protein
MRILGKPSIRVFLALAIAVLSSSVGADAFSGAQTRATPTFLVDPVTGLPYSANSGGTGTVSIDQATPGTTDSVTVKGAGGIGSLIETAPATDTASSGLNGRLQRIAQHLTSLIGQIPASLTPGGNLKVAINESSGHSATVTITRPSNTDAYLAGDVIGDTNGSAIFTFPNMARAAGDVIITSIEVEIDTSSIPSGMTGFNVRLYNASPTAIADNAAWDLPAGDRGKYLGKIAVNTPVDEGSTLFSDNDQLNKQITLTSTSLYVELQTIGGFTPTSAVVKRVTIHTLDS